MNRFKLGGSLLVAGAVLFAFLIAMPVQSYALENKLVIVTSYPKDLTGPFKKAFEAKLSGHKGGGPTEEDIGRSKVHSGNLTRQHDRSHVGFGFGRI